VNRQIKRLGAALVLCYLVLFAQLNIVQVLRADDLNANPENSRQVQRRFDRPRGSITSADGALLAQTVATGQEGQFSRVRQYPEGALFAHVTGYLSFLFGATGLEQQYNEALAGDSLVSQLDSLGDLFVDRENVGNLTVSLRKDLQQVAAGALGDREGSVVALDPRSGEILAMVSWPSYDPNLLASPDLSASQAAWDGLVEAPGNPLRAHAYRERYFPGSTFKVVTAGIGLATDTVSDESPRYPVERSWTPPLTTQSIANFGGSACGGTLPQVLRVSCNTAFARMGVETIGPELMPPGAEAWGFNDSPPIDLPDPVVSTFPTDFERDLPRLAQASIGQNDVAASALQMALVAGTVGNEGRMTAPRVVTEVRDDQGEVVQTWEPETWKTPLEPDDAAVLRGDMVGVVEGGTATVLATPGWEVGGKTGTAQLGTEPPRSHTWITAFAGQPGLPARVAVAVVVLNQPGAREATGGAVAGPIAKAMLDAVLALPDDGGTVAPAESLQPAAEPGAAPGQGGEVSPSGRSGDASPAPTPAAPTTPTTPTTPTPAPAPSSTSTTSSSTTSPDPPEATSTSTGAPP
jgi:peptidoglycan glycosyltransferase